MTRFKAKLRRIGNSQGIYIPLKVITGYSLGEEIEVEVITKEGETKEQGAKVITPVSETRQAMVWCDKHSSWKISCGCK